VLGAANAALPTPPAQPATPAGLAPAGDAADDALGRLWQAATTLREHRGDGHNAALLAAGVDGCEALVLRCGLDLRREDLQPVRGWTDEQWEAALARLVARGLAGQDGEQTETGLQVHRAVEEATDRAAARPWARLGEERAAELEGVLAPLARACGAVIPYPSPIGVPAPAAGA
jgi:hypothetical protein